MNAARELRDARRHADLTQTALAARAGTSQATVSAYESGRKQPSLETFSRLLAATGAQIAVVSRRRPVVQPSAEQHARVARTLSDVLALAEALPSRPNRELRFPRFPAGERAAA